MSQLCVLVHSFNGYVHLWPGHEKAHRDNWNLQYPEIFFGSDIETEHKVGAPFKMTYSGPGEWSNRLTKLLLQLPFEDVLYMQEDHYPFEPPPLTEAMEIVLDRDLFRLQLSPINQFYSLTGYSLPFFFHPSSKYLVSHQPSIWRKDFLLSCLKPGETPWVNEYEGTKRLQNSPGIAGKIAILPCDWFEHKCVKGRAVDSGIMLSTIA